MTASRDDGGTAPGTPAVKLWLDTSPMAGGATLHLAVNGVEAEPSGHSPAGVALCLLPDADEAPAVDDRLSPDQPAAGRFALLLSDAYLAAAAAAPQFMTTSREVFLYRFGEQACLVSGDIDADALPTEVVSATMPWGDLADQVARLRDEWELLRPPPQPVPPTAALIGSREFGVLLAPEAGYDRAFVHFQLVVEGAVVGVPGPDLVRPAMIGLLELGEVHTSLEPLDPGRHDAASRWRRIARDENLRHRFRLDGSESLDAAEVFIHGFGRDVCVLACSDSAGVVEATLPRERYVDIATRARETWQALTGSS